VNLRRIDNPPNPYLSEHREWLEPPPEARIEVYEERSGSILSKNDSPDLPFTWSVNPYRGCQHGCSYCYARPYHEYLGLGAGTDYETKLIVKVDAPDLLRAAFRKPSWDREAVHFSGITDCYQPLEAGYRITRRCLEACLDYANPAAVVTKSFLVVRDADVLADLHARAGARVLLSIPFADAETSRLMEPHAPALARRFEAIRRLSGAGVPVGVFVSPVIAGLNDRDIPEILRRAAEAGAQSASYTCLRLPGSVEEVFTKRLREAMPLRADRVLNRLREVRGGRLDETRFHERMRGRGVYWESIRDLFAVSRKRYGLDASQCAEAAPAEPHQTPGRGQSQLLFEFSG
jgi:DNA repair photolyase